MKYALKNYTKCGLGLKSKTEVVQISFPSVNLTPFYIFLSTAASTPLYIEVFQKIYRQLKLQLQWCSCVLYGCVCAAKRGQVEAEEGCRGLLLLLFIWSCWVCLHDVCWWKRSSEANRGQRPLTNLVHHQIIITLIRIAALWEKEREGEMRYPCSALWCMQMPCGHAQLGTINKTSVVTSKARVCVSYFQVSNIDNSVLDNEKKLDESISLKLNPQGLKYLIFHSFSIGMRNCFK